MSPSLPFPHSWIWSPGTVKALEMRCFVPMPISSTIGTALIFWSLSSPALLKLGLKGWLTHSLTLTHAMWTSLVSSAASGCFGMKAPPSVSRLSLVANTVFMLLWRYLLHPFPFYLPLCTPLPNLISANRFGIIYKILQWISPSRGSS